MKKYVLTALALTGFLITQAKSIIITVRDNIKYQTVTGFGAAACDGAMCPFGTDTKPVQLLYGPTSKIGLNIMRMEISPNFKGDINASDIGWDTPYDWKGSLYCARLVKQRGGIVFGTPWSPPGEYKTNGTAQGGNADDQGNKRGELRADCYEKFFPWLNTFLSYMKSNGVAVDAVSIQNEPDWWVNYSGCLYTPEQQLKLVKNYAYMLDREKFPGVRLISAEPLGFDPRYSDPLMKDKTARDQIDIIAGHLYGHPPLGNMKQAAVLAAKYGKEVWMTEHSVTDNLPNRLPSWHEQLLFAEELNECMQAGCTGYIYWYMRAQWAFVGNGETKYGTANKKNQLLPRAYVISHFAKNVTGATRVYALAATYAEKTEAAFETTAYMKGDSIIVMAIDTTGTDSNIRIRLPYNVKSGVQILSTGNETANLCQQIPITIDEPVNDITIPTPARSLSTFIFMIDRNAGTGVDKTMQENQTGSSVYYDLQGHRISGPKGLCIEQRADGTSRKMFVKSGI